MGAKHTQPFTEVQAAVLGVRITAASEHKERVWEREHPQCIDDACSGVGFRRRWERQATTVEGGGVARPDLVGLLMVAVSAAKGSL